MVLPSLKQKLYLLLSIPTEKISVKSPTRVGKKQMRFQLDKSFNAEKVQVSVTYLDRGTGSWTLGVPGKAFKQVTNKGSGKWKNLKVTVPRKALKNAELLLNYEGGDDTIFHMIEIERI